MIYYVYTVYLGIKFLCGLSLIMVASFIVFTHYFNNLSILYRYVRF